MLRMVHDHDNWNAEARGETPMQRADRAYGEILQEVRVAQTGVQILFAFLLTAAFSARAGELTGARQTAYVVSVIASMLAAVALMAPVVVHRVLFRHGAKDRLVTAAQWLTVAGMALLAVSIVSAVWVVLDLVVRGAAATVLTVGCGLVLVLVWVVLPAALHRGLR